MVWNKNCTMMFSCVDRNQIIHSSSVFSGIRIRQGFRQIYCNFAKDQQNFISHLLKLNLTTSRMMSRKLQLGGKNFGRRRLKQRPFIALEMMCLKKWSRRIFQYCIQEISTWRNTATSVKLMWSFTWSLITLNRTTISPQGMKIYGLK